MILFFDFNFSPCFVLSISLFLFCLSIYLSLSLLDAQGDGAPCRVAHPRPGTVCQGMDNFYFFFSASFLFFSFLSLNSSSFTFPPSPSPSSHSALSLSFLSFSLSSLSLYSLSPLSLRSLSVPHISSAAAGSRGNDYRIYRRNDPPCLDRQARGLLQQQGAHMEEHKKMSFYI